MTVNVEIPFVKYIGNGITSDYTFRWSCDDANENYVKQDGVLLKEGVEYELEDFTLEYGGAIVFNLIPPVNSEVLLYRQTPITQQVDYVEAEPFQAQTHEGQMDKDTRILQELIFGGIGIGGPVDLDAIQWPTYVEVTNTSGTNANILPWTVDGLLAGVSMGEVIQFGDTAPTDGNPTTNPDGYIWWQLGPLPDTGGDITVVMNTAPLVIDAQIPAPEPAIARVRYMAHLGDVQYGFDPLQPLVDPVWTTVSAIEPSPIALQSYWIKFEVLSGSVEGSTADVWLDVYVPTGGPQPYYEWYVSDPGTTQTVTAELSVAPDDGGGSPNLNYAITRSVTLTAGQI